MQRQGPNQEENAHPLPPSSAFMKSKAGGLTVQPLDLNLDRTIELNVLFAENCLPPIWVSQNYRKKSMEKEIKRNVLRS